MEHGLTQRPVDASELTKFTIVFQALQLRPDPGGEQIHASSRANVYMAGSSIGKCVIDTQRVEVVVVQGMFRADACGFWKGLVKENDLPSVC